MSRCARWCFTKNNADDGWRPVYDPESMVFLVWERETAPTTGMRHLQGYVRFKSRKTLASAKRALHEECHFEAARGSEEDNYKYCTKEREGSTDWAEEGTYDPAQKSGRRTDLEDVTNDIREGACTLFF